MHHKPPQLRDLLLSYKIKGKTAILFFFFLVLVLVLIWRWKRARMSISCHDVTSCQVQLWRRSLMLMKLMYKTKLNGNNHEPLAPPSTEWTESLAGEVQKKVHRVANNLVDLVYILFISVCHDNHTNNKLRE